MNIASHTQRTFLRQPKQVSLLLLLIALGCLFGADIEVIRSNPWLELTKLSTGLLNPSVFSWPEILEGLASTLAFAIQGIAAASLIGFAFALGYQHGWIRSLCAFLRSIHELFWALIFIQLFGLSPLTGLLAIAVPYAGTLGKIYGELLEESDRRAQYSLIESRSISAFLYTRLPMVWPQFCSYTSYRFECAIRSSVVLGFVGLPTIGFYLETALSEGQYSNAAALLYILIGVIFCLPWLLHKRLIPLYILTAVIYLPPQASFSWEFIARFFGHDIIPAPLRAGGDTAELWGWFLQLWQHQLLPGMIDTILLSQLALVFTGIIALLCFPLNSPLFLKPFAKRCGDTVLIICRTLPEYLLAFVLLLLFGPSMLPAIIALAFHNGAIIAHLIGRFSEQLRLRDDACSGINCYVYEAVPRLYRQFLSLLLYRWEVIIRETAILGMLGISTLGFYIDSAFEEFRFDRAFVLILASALINLGVDVIARILRRRLHLRSNLQHFTL